MTPGHAFLLFFLGLFAVYAELVWPGRALPGLAGCALILVGGYFLWQRSPTPIGMALIGLAALLFLCESYWRLYFVPGTLATVALALGFCLLIDAPHRIPAGLAIPISVLFGGTTVFLSWSAKRARENKWSDIDRRCAGSK